MRALVVVPTHIGSYTPGPSLRTFGAVWSRKAPFRSSGGSTPSSKMRMCERSRMPMMWPSTSTSSPALSSRIASSVVGKVRRLELAVILDLPVGVDDRLEHELLDPLHAVGGDAHLQEAHVLAARTLRHALHVEPIPVRNELSVHDRQPMARDRPGVLARDRVHGVRAQRMLDRGPLGTGLQRG